MINSIQNILNELKEGLFIALRAIKSNKVRTALTTLGIVIGITSVVSMSTAINGIDKAFQEGISSLGSDVLYIDKWAWFSNQEWWKMINRKNITMEEYNKFKELAKNPIAVAPMIDSRQLVKNGEKTLESVPITGTDADYVNTTNFVFTDGRFFSELESNASRYVAVIGSEIAQNLFDRVNPVDKYIKIGGISYKVIGVLEKQGSFLLGNFNPDNQIYVPIGTVFRNFIHSNRTSVTIVVRASNTNLIEDTKEEATEVMRKVRGLKYNQEDDFSVNQQEGLVQNYNSTVGVIQIAGLFITGLSLFVGAIGIMNIMFVSVKERTREIGIRKAIGATRRTILMQFLLESSTICLLGGIIGLMIAIILSMVVRQFLPTSISVGSFILAITISLITGIVSGLAPAYSAAKLDPVESLRYE